MTDETAGLWRAAVDARGWAYAPYSQFQVGAALRTPAGEVFSGCNVENAAYPEGTCAEAGAIASMVRHGHTAITELVVVGPGGVLCTPCGGCRQKIREFAGPNVPIHVGDAEQIVATFTLDELLPASFGPDNLGSL